MKKAVLIPDSVKGTLSSSDICGIMKSRIDARFPGCEVVSIPVADGGEGSVDAFLTALGGEKVRLEVKNPYFEPMEAFYGLIDNGKTAVVEMAACAGLPLVEGRRDPSKTTTYGVGQLILDAAQKGVSKIVSLRSLAEGSVLVAMTAGTVQPKPISMGTMLRPLRPILRSSLSMKNATRAI